MPFYKDYYLPEELKWKPGDFAAHFTGMPLERPLTAVQEVQDQVAQHARMFS